MTRILLVEDEHNIRLFIAALLNSKGHVVLEAEDGHEALNLLRTPDAFDLLITDLVMPRVDGLQVIEVARKDNPTLPIIAMSAYHDRLDEAQAKGADHCLRKPFGRQQLLDCIASMGKRLTD